MSKIKKKILALFVNFLMIFSYFVPFTSVYAISKPEGAEWLVEDHVWYMIEENTPTTNPKTYTITFGGEGAMKDWISSADITKENSYKNSPWADKNITDVVIEEGITKLGDYSFNKLASIKSLKLAKSVKEIGVGTFADCTSLKNISFAKGLEKIGGAAFKSCGFTTMIIPDGVTIIEGMAFEYNLNLTKVVLPSSVTSIGQYGFYGCTNLDTIISYRATAPSIEDKTFKADANTLLNIKKIMIPASGNYEAWGTLLNKEGVTVIDGYFIEVESNNNDMGTVTASEIMASKGTEISLTATAKTGYHFEKWESADVDVSNGKFTMPDKDVKVKAVFEVNPRIVKVTPSGISTRVVISDVEDFGETSPSPWVKECKAEDGSTKTISVDYVVPNKYYILIEPDFFTGGKITSIKINGESKNVSHPTGKNVYEVAAANEYNVVIEGVNEAHYNIMWANEGANVSGTDFDSEEVMLKNGSAKIVKVYDNINDMNDITDEIEHSDDGCVDPEGKGYVDLTEGNVVIFEFLPKAGYQLTSVSANGSKLEAQDTMNQYKYIMPATNVHFQATFTKTDDVVKSTTDIIANGSIKLDKNEIDAGTSRLTVNEAIVTNEQKETMIKEAGDYKISNILDIKLDQIFYKGSENSEDVWEKSLGNTEDLKESAEITLKLADDVDGNEIVLVHEKEDGTYEIIKTDYDKESNTITFKTKSFSNYAIATKYVKNTTDNPKTGDTIIITFVAMGISVAVMYIFTKKIKVKRKV